MRHLVPLFCFLCLSCDTAQNHNVPSEQNGTRLKRAYLDATAGLDGALSCPGDAACMDSTIGAWLPDYYYDTQLGAYCRFQPCADAAGTLAFYCLPVGTACAGADLTKPYVRAAIQHAP